MSTPPWSSSRSSPARRTTLTFPDAPRARYICVRHTRPQYLSVAELEAFAPEVAATPTPTPTPPSAPVERRQVTVLGKTYVVVEGDMLVEPQVLAAAGGQLLPPPPTPEPTSSYLVVNDNALPGQVAAWPEGIVPYVITADAERFRATVSRAQAIIQKKVNVTFMARQDGQSPYLVIDREPAEGDDASVCSSAIGAQHPTSLTLRDGCGHDVGVVLHELLHALGARHEQSRTDRASSLKLQGGITKVALWDEPNYRGRCIVYRGDIARFEGFNDDFASLKVERECSTVKATLFLHTNFEGTAMDLNADAATLGRMNDEVSSIRVGPGVTLALFSEPSYRGTCSTLTGSAVRLTTTIGTNDSVSSIWVGRPCPGPAATFFQDTNYRGRTVAMIGDVRNMKDIGFNDAASSIRLTGGAPMAVYKDTEFRGRCTTVRGDLTNMRSTSVGNDNISSVRVRWTCEGGPVR